MAYVYLIVHFKRFGISVQRSSKGAELSLPSYVVNPDDGTENRWLVILVFVNEVSR
jgi:hypothetical protein